MTKTEKIYKEAILGDGVKKLLSDEMEVFTSTLNKSTL